MVWGANGDGEIEQLRMLKLLSELTAKSKQNTSNSRQAFKNEGHGQR